MKKDMDCIQFESRYEIDEVCGIISEWQKTHGANDDKAETAEKLLRLLDVMYMEW